MRKQLSCGEAAAKIKHSMHNLGEEVQKVACMRRQLTCGEAAARKMDSRRRLGEVDCRVCCSIVVT